MDPLPDLVWLEVFSFVSVEDRFKTLRLVCKRWKQMVEFQIQKELVVYESEHPIKKLWPSNDRPIDMLTIIGRISFFNFYLNNGHYKAIKRLFFGRIDWTRLQGDRLMANLIDCLCQLEELSIDQIPYDSDWFNNDAPYDIFALPTEHNIKLHGLTFPNLRVLSVKQDLPKKISITAPRLEILVVWNLFFNDLYDYHHYLMITLSHPERLRYLQCQLINQETRVFSNLERLSALHVKLDFDLSHYRKLKRLDLCLVWAHRQSEFYQTIEQLKKQKEKLRLNHLEITQFGAKDEVISNRLCRKYLGEGILFSTSELDSFLKNFTVDYTIPWSIRLTWHDSPTTTRGFNGLCRSRLNIEYVHVLESKLLKSDLLVKFLVEIGGVRHLTLQNCSFYEKHFEKLTTVPYIASLAIGGPLPATEFEFICNINFLNELILYVNPSFAVDSFFNAFKRSKIQRLMLQIGTAVWKGYCGRGPRLMIQNNQILLKVGCPGRELKFDNLDALSDTFQEEIQKFSKCERFYQ